MEQGKSDNSYKSSVCIVIVAISGIVIIVVGKLLWKLAELIIN